MDSDKIGEAIAAADEPAPGTMYEVRTSTGRTFAVGMPDDATDGEIAEVAGWITTKALTAARQYRAEHAPARLVLAHRLPS